MLPFGPPFSPMLGLLADGLPEGDGWAFEPKWDGFRVLVFRDGDALDLRSRDDRPLARFFPELLEPLRSALPPSCVVDGEILLVVGGAVDFERLQMRLHPAASRVQKLAAELPAAVVVWDLLALGADDLRGAPFHERRARLAQALAPSDHVQLTPHTTRREVAADWFARFEGAGLDGVMAKRLADPYQPGKRAMVKVKHVRTVDAVVAGFRWHKGQPGREVGSLVLGLYDDAGDLHPIGVASSFTAKERKRLVDVLVPLADPPTHPWSAWAEGDLTGENRSRWSAGRDLSWVPIQIEKVVEITTTQSSPRRLRHPAHVRRWRDDKAPRDCGRDQLHVVPAPELRELFGSASVETEGGGEPR